MPLIDNKTQTLQKALANALQTSDRVYVSVGYFYFSGFEALAEELRDKHVRVLVGMEVDPKCIPDIVQFSRESNEDLSRWQPRQPTRSALGLKQNYIDALVGFMNDSDTFDSKEAEKAFEIFVEKLNNGTLEIRKTLADNHGKFYLLYNKPQFSQNGDYPGTVFVGSSNLTYRGLVGQGELNDSHRDKAKFEEYQAKFEELWNTSKSVVIADKHNKDEFINELKKKVWKYHLPTPYEMYIRVLHETFKNNIQKKIPTPAKITNSQYFDLEYQIDAIKMGLDRLQKYDGVIVADVVGLGKSIIASTIARILDIKTVIIAPPHLNPQWEDYKEQFGIRGSRIFSSGNIKEVYERYQDSSVPLLLILDEAHRYRNEDTNDYKLLHQICRSNPENKILILTATPFNNAPKDIFALVKLFQTPGQATIRSVDNLSLRFRELIDRYKKLRREITKGKERLDIDREAEEIATEQRRLIESVVIRRSRLDLKHITRYRKDLERQNIDFSEVQGPDLMKYDLGPLLDLYLDTLSKITDEGEDGFTGARYKPTTYDLDVKSFKEKYGDLLDESDLKTAQTNLADFMRRLLVMRFESSKFAFKSTLLKMIDTNKLIERWWDQFGMVPIMKKGQLPDPEQFTDEDGEEISDLEEAFAQLGNEKGLIVIPKEMLGRGSEFILDVRHDRQLLRQIYQDWFDNEELKNVDPKTDDLAERITKLLTANSKRKIVIFSAYADTVNYLYEGLSERGIHKLLKYTAADATSSSRKTVTKNFDASIPSNEQSDEYDVLIATDALSEGYNLHRAGVVINYDIPYNPTRVIQRVGRINRINKKVFDKLYVYNSFPTAVGEAETRVKQISTLKMNLINAIIGSDTKHLTSDEKLQSFFRSEFDKAETEAENLSWDAPHKEAYDNAVADNNLMEEVLKIPRRSRIGRKNTKDNAVIVFGKKGDESIFTISSNNEEPLIISAEQAIRYFAARKDDESHEVKDKFAPIFNKAKEKLFAKHPLPSIKGRRGEAIKRLQAIKETIPSAENYCADLIKVIKEYDDISEGALKDITQLDLRNIEDVYNSLLSIIPIKFIRNVIDRAHRTDENKELLLLAEELEV